MTTDRLGPCQSTKLQLVQLRKVHILILQINNKNLRWKYCPSLDPLELDQRENLWWKESLET